MDGHHRCGRTAALLPSLLLLYLSLPNPHFLMPSLVLTILLVVAYRMDENWKSAAAVPASTQRSTDINPTNKRSPAAFNIAFDTEKPLFQWLSSDQTRFDRFMRAVSAGGYGGCEVVAQVYPWRNLGPATVVDVGGGTLPPRPGLVPPPPPPSPLDLTYCFFLCTQLAGRMSSFRMLAWEDIYSTHYLFIIPTPPPPSPYQPLKPTFLSPEAHR